MNGGGDGGFAGDGVGLEVVLFESLSGWFSDGANGFVFQGLETPLLDEGFDAGGAGKKDGIKFR